MKKFPSNGAAPPERPRDVFWVEQIAGGERQKWRIYSPQVWGVWTHWDAGTSPCYENHKFCKGTHDPLTLRWKGYVLGWCYKENKIAYVQLTNNAIESWNAQIAGDAVLRGQMVYIARTTKAKGRLTVTVEDYQTTPGAGLPPDCDPRKSLYQLWGIPDPGHKWATNPDFGRTARLFRENA